MTGTLYAISDVHVGHPRNRRAWQDLPSQPDDGLVLAGDLCETIEDLDFVLGVAKARFGQVLWVPGNHELWTMPSRGSGLRGDAKYQALVACCRRHGVRTPEDPFLRWPDENGRYLLAPLFVLYDYSFHPDEVPPHEALAWARDSGIECTDEHLLHPDPFPSRQAWCAERVRLSEERLHQAVAEHDGPLVLINHFPLRRELAVLPFVPRFVIWCGTRKTETWHQRFRAEVVVFGHLHIRQTRVIDGVRFEEVSLGYPRQWREERGVAGYLRPILQPPERAQKAS